MNIFLTDPDPSACAKALDNRRVVKMVLETAQLLSTTCHVLGADTSKVYRPTHTNHPCAVFARQSLANFQWLAEHGIHLAYEYEHRFGRQHASEDTIAAAVRSIIALDAAPDGWAAPLDFSFNCSGFASGDLFNDYRLCMKAKWENDRPAPKWSHRGPPKWRK